MNNNTFSGKVALVTGGTSGIVRVANDCGRWLAESRIPKLFINAEPGAILTGPALKTQMTPEQVATAERLAAGRQPD